jgi:arabinofuranosyltransferase
VSVLYVLTLLALVAGALLAWWRASPADAPPPADAPRAMPTTLDVVTVAALAALAIALCASRMYLDRYLVFDDSYISYRYALHLSQGHGLVWNPGEAPLEGYTNPLLVVLLAPFLRAGLDPLAVTRVWSGLAACGLVALAYVRARRETTALVACAVAATYALSNAAFRIAMVGLETVLFACAVFLAYHFAADYLETARTDRLAAAGLALLVALGLRPEALFLAVLLSVVALPADVRAGRWRRHLATLSLTFWLPLGLYLAWKWWYFGALVPNPALIKMGGSGLVVPDGVVAVLEFFEAHVKLLPWALLALFAARRAEAPRLLAALMLAAYAAFYLRVDPLMNIHGRFLFPAAPFLFELARPAFVWAHERWLGLRRLPLLRLVAVPVAFVVAVLPQPEEDLQAVKRALRKEWAIAPEPTLTSRPGHSGHIRKVGLALGAFPGVERLTIASVDAGVLAYCSRARHVDIAGLNDRVIARERDPQRLADYLFGREPDLLFQRERTDGTLITYGHGPLGDHRKWASHPGWDGYLYAGSITDVEPWRHELHVYVRSASPAAAELRELVRTRLADRVHETPPFTFGTARAAAAR